MQNKEDFLFNFIETPLIFNKNMINNVSVFNFLKEIKFLFPLVIDTTN